MIELTPVVPWAGQYTGIPFVDLGRERTGTDCWGLVRIVYSEQLGIDLPSYGGEYTRSAEMRSVARVVDDVVPGWVEIARRKGGAIVRSVPEEPGDVALLWLTRPRNPSHVGVVIGGGRLLHAAPGRGAVVDRYTEGWLETRMVGIYRHPDRAAAA